MYKIKFIYRRNKIGEKGNNLEKERKTSYIIYFFLVFTLCFSTFLFEMLNKRGAVMAHCFTDYNLAMLLNMRISVNMLALANTLYRLVAYGLIGFLAYVFRSRQASRISLMMS